MGHGWPLHTYVREVRAHLREVFEGCGFWSRMLDNRFEGFLNSGELPILFDTPGMTKKRPMRGFTDRLCFYPFPDTPITYGYLTDNPGASHLVQYYGPIAVELNVKEEATFFEGDAGWLKPDSWRRTSMEDEQAKFRAGHELLALLTHTWDHSPQHVRQVVKACIGRGSIFARVPSPIIDPHELSWSWVATLKQGVPFWSGSWWEAGGCPLVKLQRGQVHAHPAYFEAQVLRRVTLADVKAVHFDSERDFLPFKRRLERLMIPVVVHSGERLVPAFALAPL